MFLCSVLSQGRIASVQDCSRNELNRGMDAFVLFHFPETLPVSKPNLTSSHQDFSRQRKFQLWEGAWFGGFYTPNLTGEWVTALSCSFLLHRHCTPRYHCWLPSLPPSLCASPPVLPATLLEIWEKVQGTWLWNKVWNPSSMRIHRGSLQHGENFTQNTNSAHRSMKLHKISGILWCPKSARYKGLKINIYVGKEEMFISSIFNEFFVSCR